MDEEHVFVSKLVGLFEQWAEKESLTSKEVVERFIDWVKGGSNKPRDDMKGICQLAWQNVGKAIEMYGGINAS